MFKFNKSSGSPRFGEAGQVARLLLVLAAIVLVAIVITFLIVKMAEKPPKPVVTEEPKIPLPVYEKQLGNIKFVFLSARDLGNTLKASDTINTNYGTQRDLVTVEKFIEVKIGAQNMGTANTEANAWDIGDIVDSDGRRFVPTEGYVVSPWLPAQDLCRTLLKPAFDPTPCIKIYEVAKVSKNLKIEVVTGLNNNSANDLSAGKKSTYLLDLIVK